MGKKTTEPIPLENEWPNKWPLLQGGVESEGAAKLREHLFEVVWAKREARLDSSGDSFKEELVDEVLRVQPDLRSASGKLKTCLFVSPTGTQHDFQSALECKVRETSDDHAEVILRLQPAQCPNLQTTLKNIIKLCVTSHDEGDEKTYTDFLVEHKALIPMNFDLELLQRYVQRRHVSRILVSMLDVETFDTTILSELMTTLHSWSDRVPFVLFIAISTTTELFESRFSRATIATLDAHVVNIEGLSGGEDPLFCLYEKLQHSEETEIFLGPSVVSLLAGLAEDQGTTPATFTRSIKYLSMSHFFANHLSILLHHDRESVTNQGLSATVRTLPSFKSHCEHYAKGDKQQRNIARAMLTSDARLDIEMKAAVASGQSFMRASLLAIRTIRHVYHKVLYMDKYTPWESEVQLLSCLPNLIESPIFKAIVDATTFRDTPTLSQILDRSDDALNSLRDYASSTSDPDSAASQELLPLLRSYVADQTSMPSFFSSTSSPTKPTSPFTTFLAESYTLTSKSPLSQTIHPRARACLERALTRPADYLACDCCTASDDPNLSMTGVSDPAALPPTSLLLTMVNEAGVLVNVRDLWDAFRATHAQPHSSRPPSRDAQEEGEDVEDQDAIDERRILALFYRSLAELRYLGLLKQSKRKPGVELLQKTSWMGL